MTDDKPMGTPLTEKQFDEAMEFFKSMFRDNQRESHWLIQIPGETRLRHGIMRNGVVWLTNTADSI